METWEQRNEKHRTVYVPWIESHLGPLRGRSVVDFGCGQGAMTAALMDVGALVRGVDIDPKALEQARERVPNGDFRTSDWGDLPIAAVYIFCGVLEHCYPAERLAVLGAARLRAKHAVILETPNRILPMDYHGSALPWFHVLPPDIAAHYYRRSPRADFVEKINAAGDKREALQRFGTGVSWHEFEIAWPQFPAGIIDGGYDPLLSSLRPIYAEEQWALAMLQRERPDLPKCFARYYIDFIASFGVANA